MMPGSLNFLMMASAGAAFPDDYSAYWTTVDVASLIDESINNYDGAVIGATTIAGADGSALSFDGTDDVVIFGDILDDVFSGELATFTIVAYAKVASSGGGDLFSKSGDSNQGENQRQFRVICNTDGTLRMVWYGSLAGSVIRGTVTSSAVLDNAYHVYFIAFDYSAGSGDNGLSSVKIYVDSGAAEATSLSNNTGAIAPISSGTARLSYGGYVGTTGGVYVADHTGELSAGLIYPRIITSDERASIVTALTGG